MSSFENGNFYVFQRNGQVWVNGRVVTLVISDGLTFAGGDEKVSAGRVVAEVQMHDGSGVPAAVQRDLSQRHFDSRQSSQYTQSKSHYKYSSTPITI